MKRFFKEYGGVAVAIFGLLMLMFFITPAGDIVKTFISDTVSQTGSQSKVETNTQGSSEVSPSPGVTYTIEYELDGGKMSTKITSYSTLTETFELPTPYKTGYNFIGWTGSNGSTPETTVTIVKGSSGDKQYTANWRSSATNVYIYNTKYISNSGVNLGTGTIEGVIGSTQTVHAPKKDGYITPANQKVTFDNANPKTVTFIYNPTLYAITYDLDGGTVSGLKSAYTVEANDFTLPEPTKTGFTFKGWTGSNGSTPQKSVTVSKGSSGTKSYKANWEGITYTYTVAYRSTSGKSLGSTTVQGFLGDTKTVTLPAKTGYKTPDNVSVVFDTVGSKTVTVTYEPINYNISFVKNGGTYSEPAIQYNIESDEIVLGNAHKTGTGFLGWYDNASFNGSRILSIPTGSTGNKTFYAKFSVDSYSITYYLDEGTMNGGLTTYTVNTTTFNLPTPTKTGYTFKGWTGTGLSGNTMTVTIPQGSTGDREYTAHWEINEYTYTFRYLSSTGKQLGSTTITNQFREGEMVTPPDYAGYTTPAKQSVIWDSTTPKTIDFTYPIITYNISYDLNGGTASGLKTTYTVEDAQFRLPTPTKTGSSWQGWTGTGITEKRLSFSIPTGSTGNKEFYANWERNSYTYNIKYVSSNGKSLGTSSVSNYYGNTQTVSAPAKTGYNTPSSQSVKWDSTSAKTITFTYTPITYTISYNLNGGSISGQPTSYTIESNTITLPTPSRTYYSFSSWTGGNTIPAGSTGNKTFTANWSISQYRYVVVLNVNSLAGKDFDQSNYTRSVTVVINHNNTSSVSNGGAWSSSGSKCWWGEDKTQETMNSVSVASVSRQYPNGTATSDTLPTKTFRVQFASSFGCGYAQINPTITLNGNGTASVSGGSGYNNCYGYVDGCLTNNQSAVTVTSVS